MRGFFKKNRTLLIVALLVVIVASAFVYFRNSRAETAATQYQTATIERGNLTATIGATGTVRAKQTAVLVWQAAGTVETVQAKVGDTVAAGDKLASLSKTSLPQSLILAEADLASAQKSLDDLTNSNTAQAEAVVTLRDAQDAYDKASDYYDTLFKPYEFDQIVYVHKMTPFGMKRFPMIKTIKVKKADAETIKEAEQDLALAQAKLDDAQRTYDLLKDGNTTEIVAAQARVDAAQATINLARVIAPFDATVTESYPLHRRPGFRGSDSLPPG